MPTTVPRTARLDLTTVEQPVVDDHEVRQHLAHERVERLGVARLADERHPGQVRDDAGERRSAGSRQVGEQHSCLAAVRVVLHVGKDRSPGAGS